MSTPKVDYAAHSHRRGECVFPGGCNQCNPGRPTTTDGKTKRNHGKRRWATLLGPLFEPLGLVVDAFEAGLGKEGRNPGDWKAAVRDPGGREVYLDALLRHVIGAASGNGLDDGEGGSGLPHLALVGANTLILLWDRIQPEETGTE